MIIKDEKKGLESKFGNIEGSTGSMGSRKTFDTIGIINDVRFLAEEKKHTVVVTKSAVDTRGKPNELRSGKLVIHNVIPVEHSDELYILWEQAKRESYDKYRTEKVVFTISEIQFFDDGVLDFAKKKVDKNVYLAWDGLSENFRGEPFTFKDSRRNMNELIALSDPEYIHQKVATCCLYDRCMNAAPYTQRLNVEGEPDHWSTELVKVSDKGKDDVYQARCAEHHIVPGKEEARMIKEVLLRWPEGYSGKGNGLKIMSETLNIPLEETVRILDAYEREGWITQENGVYRSNPL